ncbi:MAG: DUF4861 domain-containing protein [Ignavibacteriales bacterium]|nr:DUF4861 domain-containing protein [Ignavibacteriales bacterium]
MKLNFHFKRFMKIRLILCLLIVFGFQIQTISASENQNGEGKALPNFYIKAQNNLDREQQNVLISIPLDKIKIKYNDFNENAFIAFDGNTQIPTQTEDLDGDKIPDNILLLLDFKANEKKTITVQYDKMAVLKKEFKKRTQAILAAKVDYTLKDGFYTGGKFVNVPELKMPQNHFAHDALIKFEGPGWESDKVAYRFYLDSRNRNDIFAKKIDDVVLDRVGNNDLVSDSKESYTVMCDWGMDVFKVGESLGIGSIGMWYDGKVNTISKTEKVVCKILTDGIIKSNILTQYSGWQVGQKKFDLNSLISISAGSRLTKEEITLTGNAENICTGLAKHEGCSLINDENNLEWSYIASYGKQSLAGDNLGLALFFKRTDLLKITEDPASFITILKPADGKLTYYFAAAPEMELNGIKFKEEFINYLNDTILELGNPVNVEY